MSAERHQASLRENDLPENGTDYANVFSFWNNKIVFHLFNANIYSLIVSTGGKNMVYSGILCKKGVRPSELWNLIIKDGKTQLN